jgi:hypothetical protein
VTDARYPDRWLSDRRLLRLSGDAFKLYVTSLVWAVTNRTDGELLRTDLPLIPGVDVRCAAELVAAELWQRETDGWLIVDFATTQTSRSELDAWYEKRRRDRERMAAKRAAVARQVAGQSRDMSPDVPKDRTGQDRTGGLEGRDGRNGQVAALPKQAQPSADESADESRDDLSVGSVDPDRPAGSGSVDWITGEPTS